MSGCSPFCDEIPKKTSVQEKKDPFGFMVLETSVHGQLTPLFWAFGIGEEWQWEYVVKDAAILMAGK